ncbi:hypothetical protein [Coxiella burnetii]|uniref:hypothetical protein n=1 Tax=Coxiella burnetii TaxID=777 RepID=UPI0005929958|nr:hypothetical protein [Coxiella burnetii]ATN75460.1 hypothetical protein AYM90_10595 [Coxiella burnetii]ATN77350.1 hypothetical protein AYM94_10485 [Coxiella burnetii]ATN79278.1 hypothetical protein AYM93_10560 [Coxiella burnetii]ATN81200.1 hypothetical protein AYN00_10595 [Coxiella burnetii]OYK89146.1 hypothetical protein CbuQ195_10935 [Coxiella burnetii]
MKNLKIIGKNPFCLQCAYGLTEKAKEQLQEDSPRQAAERFSREEKEFEFDKCAYWYAYIKGYDKTAQWLKNQDPHIEDGKKEILRRILDSAVRSGDFETVDNA